MEKQHNRGGSEMNSRDIDINIKQEVETLIKLFYKKFPETRSYYITATFWDDTDYELTLISNWAGKQDRIIYRKSSNYFEYRKGHIKEPYNIFVTEEKEYLI